MSRRKRRKVRRYNDMAYDLLIMFAIYGVSLSLMLALIYG